MIFARDKSQMCNNILQFAHVYAWAREHNRSVMSMRFSYKYKYFKISSSQYANFALYVLAKYTAAIKILPTASFKRITCDAEKLEQQMLKHKHIVVSGWFVRYYDLVEKYKDEICDLFTILPEFTEPVKEKMKVCEANTNDFIRLGVHIRRGDYATWGDGAYLYDNKVYAEHIVKFAEMNPQKDIHIYLSTNDQDVTESDFNKEIAEISDNISRIHTHLLGGNAPEDLFMLSECDFIIGPPSTFSLIASMYRDVPLYRMQKKDVENLKMEAFNTFNYWFRRINGL